MSSLHILAVECWGTYMVSLHTSLQLGPLHRKLRARVTCKEYLACHLSDALWGWILGLLFWVAVYGLVAPLLQALHSLGAQVHGVFGTAESPS